MKITEATTYNAFTPKSAPFEIISSDNRDIDINPIALLFTNKLLSMPKLYFSFKNCPNGIKDSANAII